MCWMCSSSGEIGKVHTIAGVEIDGGVPTIMDNEAPLPEQSEKDVTGEVRVAAAAALKSLMEEQVS